MIIDFENEYFTLKLIIASMFLVLVISIAGLFYRLHRDKLLKNKKQDFKNKTILLLEKYFEQGEDEKEKALRQMIDIFRKNSDFRDVMIAELKRRTEDERQNKKYRDLFIELGGTETTQDELLSKHPVTVYKALLDIDFFKLCPPGYIMSGLLNHKDIRVRMLASCIHFRCIGEIKAEDILNLQPVLCPMVEMKIFDELKNRHISSHKAHIRDIINECLDRDISDEMRDFLRKSSRLINKT